MAIITKNNYIIPVVRIGANEFGGSSLNIPTQEYVESLSAGIDTSQVSGNISLNYDKQEIYITYTAKFFIKNLAEAKSILGGYNQIYIHGDRDGNTGFINDVRIWKGKGQSWNVIKIDHLLRDGWNSVNMNVGGIRIKGPFLTEI